MKKLTILALAMMMVTGVSLSSEAKPKNKQNYKQAKKECLTETPSLQGKALQKCIKAKRKKS